MGAGPHGRSSRLQDCKVARPPLELDRFFFAALHEFGPEQVLLQKSICRLIERMTEWELQSGSTALWEIFVRQRTRVAVALADIQKTFTTKSALLYRDVRSSPSRARRRRRAT